MHSAYESKMDRSDAIVRHEPYNYKLSLIKNSVFTLFIKLDLLIPAAEPGTAILKLDICSAKTGSYRYANVI